MVSSARSTPEVIDHHVWFRAEIDGVETDVFVHVDALVALSNDGLASRAEIEGFAAESLAMLLGAAEKMAAEAGHVPGVIMIERIEQLQRQSL